MTCPPIVNVMPAILALPPCDSARLALEPELFFEDVDAAQPLLVRHRLGVFGRREHG